MLFRLRFLALPALALSSTVLACSASDTNNSPGIVGQGSGNQANSTGTGATGSGSTASGTGNTGNVGGITLPGGSTGNTCASVLPVIYRDFRPSGTPDGHPDFEIGAKGIKNPDGTTYIGWNDVGCGLVLNDLGADKTPQFNGVSVKAGGKDFIGIGAQRRVVDNALNGCWTAANPNATGVCLVGACVPWTDFGPPASIIQSATTFSDWYHSKDGVNYEIAGSIELKPDPNGSNVFDTNAFFPIDGKGFGDGPVVAGAPLHNYSFTTEAHVKFTYKAGQKFTFRGDDDLWIFVNGKLALDVGGLHQALQGTIDFDAQAGALGIAPGQEYEMAIFHAERQTKESNFRIETNISCFTPIPPIK